VIPAVELVQNPIKPSNPVLHVVGQGKFACNKGFLPSTEPVDNAKVQDKSSLTLARPVAGKNAFTKNAC
jgi:hypothetical protein